MSLFEDLEGYEESLVPIERSIYDYVIADSMVEWDFAEALDDMDEVKLSVKLPGRFAVLTPVRMYNPDWVFVFTVQDSFGEEREKLYLVRETKGSLDEDQLRGLEEMKIDWARRRFQVIEVDYNVVVRAEDLQGRK